MRITTTTWLAVSAGSCNCLLLLLNIAILAISGVTLSRVGADHGTGLSSTVRANTLWDLSGSGMCFNNTITILNASFWAQSPAMPSKRPFRSSRGTIDYVTKNGIAWLSTPAPSFVSYIVTANEHATVEVLNSRRPTLFPTTRTHCHFTLDGGYFPSGECHNDGLPACTTYPALPAPEANS